jgi:hypothetical protein
MSIPFFFKDPPKRIRRITLNDEDRRGWVQNHAGLYKWFLESRLGLYEFVEKHRSEITRVIKAELKAE